MRKLLVAAAVGVCSICFYGYAGDDVSSKFESMLRATYDFEPSALTDEMKENKASEIEAFWRFVESASESCVPLLRGELQKDSCRRFFYYDGAMLLAKLSQTDGDVKLAVRSIAKADLNEVDQDQYFRFVHWAGCQGYDTFVDVSAMIDCASFSAEIPEHSLRLTHDDAVLYALLPVDEKFYLDPLIARLKSEKNPRISMTIITVLAYTVSEKGQNAIKTFVNSTDDKELKKYGAKFLTLESKKSLPPRKIVSKHENLDEFLQMFTEREYERGGIDFSSFAKDAPYLVTRGDYAMLKKYRSLHSRRMSDEAVGEVEYLSMLIRYAFTSKE